MATLQHEEKIVERVTTLREWTTRLAEDLRALGVRTYPTETYFFLADFSPHDACDLVRRLREHNIFIKHLSDDSLGPGFMRMTTALPENNRHFIETLKNLV